MIDIFKRTLIGTAASLVLAAPLTGAVLLAETGSVNAQVRIASQAATQRVKLGLNKSIVIDLPADAYDILVANPAVADAVTRTSRRIYLFGKQVGETNIFVFGANGEQIVSLDLSIERDVAGLEDHLKRYLPNSDIRIELINDNVVLSGTVETPLDAKRAEQIAQLFVSGGEATTGQFSQTAAGGSAIGGVDINNPDSERRVSQIVNMLSIIGEDQVTLK
ncbi:MAG: pilus assembly protein N-terminal domain-containing protein, partial [Aliihoeflea sp.]